MKFIHTYQSLPAVFHQPAPPDAAPNPETVVLNQILADSLGVPTDAPIAEWFSGKVLPDGANPIAQAYAGHQFGHLNVLGDGRATLLGEIETANGLVDVQLKGSGRTPYSRNGDGKANLAPMLREYLISEAMQALGIPTTRSLAVVKTGEAVRRREHRTGAVLTRVASSHLRVGTFVYAAIVAQQQGNHSALATLLDYTLTRHYPELLDSDNRALALLDKVIEKQAYLVAQWQRVGFVHGVMNTDNITISGETIDYGPCAFMDNYDPATVFSSIDHEGRYAFGNQPPIMQWNMARLAESLLPLIADDDDDAIAQATVSLDGFETQYRKQWQAILCAKLGLPESQFPLAEELLSLMQSRHLDYTNTFVNLTLLASGEVDDEPSGWPDDVQFRGWLTVWQSMLTADSVTLMQAHNPIIIPRNHLVENALASAEVGELSLFHNLYAALQTPYDWGNVDNLATFQAPPDSAWAQSYQTFCGT